MCGTCHTADLGVHFTRGCSLKPRPHQRQCRQKRRHCRQKRRHCRQNRRQCRRNRRHCRQKHNVAGFGGFGDIVAGVDVALDAALSEFGRTVIIAELWRTEVGKPGN